MKVHSEISIFSQTVEKTVSLTSVFYIENEEISGVPMRCVAKCIYSGNKYIVFFSAKL